jgi:hypothetical protein
MMRLKKGWALFIFAFRILWHNRADALRMSLVPAGSVLGFAMLLYFVDPSGLDETIFSVLGVLLWSAFMLVWLNVGWHRFVLLSQRSAMGLPPVSLSGVLSYGALSALMFILALGVLFVEIFFFGLLPRNSALQMFGQPLLIVVIFALLLRLSVMLPAAAIGRRVLLQDVWQATRGAWVELIIGGVCVALVQSALLALAVIPAEELLRSRDEPLVMIPALILASAFNALLFSSFLNAVYGHYVEKRPIS